MRRIRIGSRGSNLALIQARKVRDALAVIDKDLHLSVEVIKTAGDRATDVPLHRVNAIGLFVKELEQALINDQIDIAVHSFKDVPSFLADGLSVSAVMERDDPRDALICPAGSELLTGRETVGTSSLRRKAQLLHIYPRLSIVDIRGNIETRISKVDSGYCDATILACCGMDRAGYQDRITFRFPVEDMLPAVCQGIIAIEQRGNDLSTAQLLERINHAKTMTRALAERSFLRTVNGGCGVPVGCYSEIEGGEIRIEGVVALEDGSVVVRESTTGAIKEAEHLGETLANRVLSKGGREILYNYGK